MAKTPLKNKSLGVHWMRHDLRSIDNEALFHLQRTCERIFIVYIQQPSVNDGLKNKIVSSRQSNVEKSLPISKFSRNFIDQSLLDLQTRFAHLNIPFIIMQGDAIELLSLLINVLPVDCLSFEMHYGYNETNDVNTLQTEFSHLTYIQGGSNYLLDHQHLPFSVQEMPNVFSPFRRKIEKQLTVRTPILRQENNNVITTKLVEQSCQNTLAIHTHNNDWLSALYDITEPHKYTPQPIELGNGYNGGETSANARIQEYFFTSHGIASYKQTRNGLDGWDFSSRLSAYLAHGCISPSLVFQQILAYEQANEKNDSTYWLFFELLWREFFHLQAGKHGALLFSFAGIQKRQPDTCFDEAKFDAWCAGRTGYEIVDACMQQLSNTGFMSNRGRQLVASCFVHELGLDWRYGARYFEQQLIDFDVASNYGNWQYLAGVGSDPRGHRQFNLIKQTEIYDPQRSFIHTWLKPK